MYHSKLQIIFESARKQIASNASHLVLQTEKKWETYPLHLKPRRSFKFLQSRHCKCKADSILHVLSAEEQTAKYLHSAASLLVENYDSNLFNLREKSKKDPESIKSKLKEIKGLAEVRKSCPPLPPCQSNGKACAMLSSCIKDACFEKLLPIRAHFGQVRIPYSGTCLDEHVDKHLDETEHGMQMYCVKTCRPAYSQQSFCCYCYVLAVD